jgi:hypothetical protein
MTTYSITVNLPNDYEHTFYDGVQYNSTNVEDDINHFKKLFPNYTSITVTIVKKDERP